VPQRILIADDEEGILNILSVLLTKNGYDVIKASDGQSALATFLAEKPDLAIFDVTMPPPNGFQVCQKLKTNPDFQQIPVILLTGKGTEGDRFWGMEAGADEYLTKPFDPREVLQTVKTLLGK